MKISKERLTQVVKEELMMEIRPKSPEESGKIDGEDRMFGRNAAWAKGGLPTKEDFPSYWRGYNIGSGGMAEEDFKEKARIKISKIQLEQIIQEELDAYSDADDYPPYQSKSDHYRIRLWPASADGWYYIENWDPMRSTWATVYANPRRELALSGASKKDRIFSIEKIQEPT